VLQPSAFKVNQAQPSAADFLSRMNQDQNYPICNTNRRKRSLREHRELNIHKRS